jgi:hypothetical protein
MNNFSPKTLEFPYPESIPSEWLTKATEIWNQALRLLEWKQQYDRRQKCLEVDAPDWGWNLDSPIMLEMQKHGDNWGMVCRVGRDQRIDKAKSWDSFNVEFRECRNIIPFHWLMEPPIEGYSDISLKKPFTQKRGFNPAPLHSALVQSLLKRLAQSWKEYQKGQRGKPRYRGKRNPVTSLNYDGFRHHCRIGSDGAVSLLGLDPVLVPGIKIHLLPLVERGYRYLLENPTERVLKKTEKVGLDAAARFYSLPGQYALIERAGKTYLQLSGDFISSDRPATKPEIEIYSGKSYLWHDGENKAKHFDIRASDRRIERLQKKLALKQFGSASWQKLKDKISALQRKKSAGTKGRQHYHAQLLTRHTQITLHAEMDIQPAPIPRPDGEGDYLPNGATRIAEANREKANAATGQFVALLKEHGKLTGSKIVDKRKEKEVCLDVSESPHADVKEPHASAHRQLEGGKSSSSTPKSQTEPRKRKGRNRKRERAIG